MVYALLSSHSQRVRHSVDIVEPCRDQCDLQNAAIVKSGGAKTLMIRAADLRRVLRQLHRVIQHRPFLLRDRRTFVIPPQSFNQIRIQSYSTQKLCVRFNSIETSVRHGDDRRYHFVLSAGERQILRHQRPKGREGVI